MVSSIGHTLELVDATTKEPLKEFRASDGTIWVEGKPNAEFFLRLTSPKGIRTISRIFVDGTSIGMSVQHGPSGLPAIVGIFDGGVDKDETEDKTCFEEKALKFSRIRTQDNGLQYASSPCGKVSATWYDATSTNLAIEGLPKRWNGTSASLSSSSDSKTAVGALKSEIGAQSLTSTWASSAWEQGHFRTTLTIHYCEAAGLVARNIATASELGLAAASNSQDRSNKTGQASRRSSQRPAKRAKVETIDLTDDNAPPVVASTVTNVKAEAVDLTDGNASSPMPSRVTSLASSPTDVTEIGYQEQLRTLKHRVRTGSLSLDEYEAKKVLLDDIYNNGV